jgi:hypothetical protein
MPLSPSEQLVEDDLRAIDNAIHRLAIGEINSDQAGEMIDALIGRTAGQPMGLIQRWFSKLFGKRE